MRVYVTLTDEQVADCDDIGRKRQDSAERNHRLGGNGGPVTGPRALAIGIMGARGEGAAYHWLGLRLDQWHRFSEIVVHGQPDLLDFIDVKTVERAGLRMIVQPDAPGDLAYLLVNAARHPVYEIQGWLWGWQAKIKRYWDDPVGGRAAYFVPVRDLYPPAHLKRIVDCYNMLEEEYR